MSKLRLCLAAAALSFLSACATNDTRAVPVPAQVVGGAHFASPGAAVEALVAACRKQDSTDLLALFDPKAKAIVSSGDQGADRERCEKFVKAAGQMTRLDPWGKDRMVLVVGSDDYPFPIPLVKDASGWTWDAEAGAQEILLRQIGANELAAIDSCTTYVRAQKEYARSAHDGVPKGTFAQRLISSPGRHDGLYWPAASKGDASPLGPILAAAGEYAAGQRPEGSWRGYYFRVLTAQGPAADGGAKSYLVGGRMSGGFALVAYPVAYRRTGVTTFVVDSQGKVFEKDLGPKTSEIAAAMTAFDPDSTWRAD